MYVRAGAPGARWARRLRIEPPEQVFNADRPVADLTPVSEAPAEAVRAGWQAKLPGQAVPLIGERR